MKLFVPFEDNYPVAGDDSVVSLVPYRPGLACHHAWRGRDEGECRGGKADEVRRVPPIVPSATAANAHKTVAAKLFRSC